jgi:hypothetical protein
LAVRWDYFEGAINLPEVENLREVKFHSPLSLYERKT